MFKKFIGLYVEPDEASLHKHALSSPLSHLLQCFPSSLFNLMR